MPLTTHESGTDAWGHIYPIKIANSALIESQYSSAGAVATNCTLALGFKPTAATSTPLSDMTGHYLLTIQKTGTAVQVSKQGTQFANFTGTIGTTYAEFIQNVLTEYCGSYHGYYSRLAVVEQALDYSAFWEPSDLVTGLWVPKSITGLALHTLIDFSNAANLGEDCSGNDNNWTVNGSVQTIDTPTNNYCTLNPLDYPLGFNVTYANGNRTFIGAGHGTGVFGVESGKWYWEQTIVTAITGGVGVSDIDLGQGAGNGAQCLIYREDGKIYEDGVAVYDTGTAFTANDVIGVAHNADDNQVSFYKNNSLVRTQTRNGNGLQLPCIVTNVVGDTVTFNFGATGFTYAPPDGFKALCAENLPDPTIMKSAEVADIVLREGTDAATSISSLEFAPDFVNIKNRNDTTSWYLTDIERGATNTLFTNAASAEVTYPYALTSFDSSGYTVDSQAAVNSSGASFIDLCLKAGVDQGFEIKEVTALPEATINHSLGKTPTFIILKRLDASGAWFVWHKDLGNSKFLQLSETAAAQSASNWCVPTTTTVTFSPAIVAGNYIAYLFTDSDIFKAFSYTGNGSTNGPFVNLGGKPLSIPFYTNSSAYSNWYTVDGVRDPSNPIDVHLYPDLSNAEGSGTNFFEFSSTGAKMIYDGAYHNGSGNLIVGLAILESTKYRNAF